jgi:hypothetical protein
VGECLGIAILLLSVTLASRILVLRNGKLVANAEYVLFPLFLPFVIVKPQDRFAVA